MSDPLVYDSRSVRFKSPYGAVPSGTQVTFTLRPLRSEGYSRGKLTARLEQRDNQIITVELPWTDTDLGRDAFSGVLDTGDYVGLVWYTFQLETITGRRWNIKEEYQLTVYDGSEIVPRWFGEGVSYQIFPDRFRRTRVPDPAGLVGGRTVHQSWQEEPEYRPDANGEIRNRDFFGGDLRGVIEELDYLQSLGVETLYFNPIFEAAENHRYGTADYSRVDPMLGTNEDFSELCRQAHRRGMRVMLDGVFNHTGFVSRYFNGDGYYPEPGAVQSESSPYRPWFQFRHWPDQYESWWGIYTLPAVEESCPGYREFIFGDENSVVRRWLRAGADGWRLDVSPEVYPDFWRQFRRAVLQTKPDAIMIAECWHDSREWCTVGDMFDGTMHYVLSEAIWKFFAERRWSLAEFDAGVNRAMMLYPQEVQNSMWNFLSSHDTACMLTRCGGRVKAMRAAVFFQMTHPGVPVIYYGDELAMRGGPDPDCRRSMTWDKVDGNAMLAYYKRLTHMRGESEVLREGTLRTWEVGEDGLYAYLRQTERETVLCALNTSERAIRRMIRLPEALAGCKAVRDLMTGKMHNVQGGYVTLALGACEGAVLGRAEA